MSALGAALASASLSGLPALSVIHVVLCVGTVQVVLFFVLVRHLDAKLVLLARQINRVELVSDDELAASRAPSRSRPVSVSSSRGAAVIEDEGEEEDNDAASMIEPFTTSPVSISPSSASGGSQLRGYAVRQQAPQDQLGLTINTYAGNYLTTSASASASASTIPCATGSGSRPSSPSRRHYSYMPSPIEQRARYVHDASAATYERPALSRSVSNPRPYRSPTGSGSGFGSYIPSPLSRQCSLPGTSGSSYSYALSSSSRPWLNTSSSSSSSAASSCSSRASSPVPTLRARNVYPASCPTSPAAHIASFPSSVNEPDHGSAEGPAMYTNAKLSFRRHKDAYASLSYDEGVTTRGSRSQGRRTEWVDLPPMYDEVAWSPVSSGVERSATL